MCLEDLIEVVPSPVPLLKTNESAYVFIGKLQSEYDTLVLESHRVRSALKETKQEIMHCSYQN